MLYIITTMQHAALLLTNCTLDLGQPRISITATAKSVSPEIIYAALLHKNSIQTSKNVIPILYGYNLYQTFNISSSTERTV